ncbi:MAG TPA: hypothetical protein DCG38_02780 [Eubacteriaceae bacterium]|jgi:hypothetical protein|nr:hypothetical protein [Eubacteriaceae bacterium]
MPRRDGTGPMGQGVLTGRGLGSCETGASKRSIGAIGVGLGLGLGLGCRRGFKKNSGPRYNSMNQFESKEELRKQKEVLEAKLKEINEALED